MVLSQMRNRRCCVMRPNNGCKGDCSKHGTNAFYFCTEVVRNRDNRPQNICVSLDRLFFLFLLKWSNVIFSFFWKLWKHQEHKVSHFDLPSWKNNSSMLCMSMFYTRLCCIWTSSLPSSHGIWDCNTSKFHISTSEIYLEGVHGFAGVLKKKNLLF